ncbi:MAG: hypothetical protein ACLR2E_22760 [Lachnospiraceae bacterium]
MPAYLFGGTASSEVRRQIEVGRQWLNNLSADYEDQSIDDR